VPNPTSLHDLLDHTCQMLREIRKAIAAAGHLEAMLEVDSLIADAQSEAERNAQDPAKNVVSRPKPPLQMPDGAPVRSAQWNIRS
jgi:hypothetical protein